jgi:hypothetical protein
MYQKLRIFLATVFLSILVCWGIFVSIIGANVISIGLERNRLFAMSADILVQTAVSTFILGMVWVPIGIVTLINMHRARGQCDALRKWTRRSWWVLVAFLVTVGVWIVKGVIREQLSAGAYTAYTVRVFTRHCPL